MPSAAAQIKNASLALMRAGKAAVTGHKLKRTDEEKKRCLDVCATCDQWDSKSRRCLQCGCYGALKARLATESCPLGKWPVFDIGAE